MLILDMTAEQKNPPTVKGRHRLSHGKVVKRHPQNVTGITVHQTACVFGPMDNPEKRHARALNVACHALAFRDSVIALPNPILWYVHHGNQLNATTLGLEIEGHYAGTRDDPKTPRREDIASTWGSKPTPLLDTVILTAQEALEELFTRAIELGCPIEYVYAHRQSSPSRMSDPGWEIWQTVVLDFAVKKLKLKTQNAFTVGGGKPIPKQWDPSSNAEY